MSGDLILRPYQKLIIDHIIAYKRCAIWAGMGLGKTSSVLAALEALNLLEDIYPVLIIAPKRVALNTWPDEVQKWGAFKHIKVSTVLGSLYQRENALAEVSDMYTTNFENLPWLIAFLGKKWPFKTVIIDEASKLKGFRTRQGSIRAKKLATVAHTLVSRMILLTGTPAANGIEGLWGQTWFIDKGERLGKSFSAFSERWFMPNYNGFGIRPTEGAQVEVQNAVKDVCLTIKSEDWFDLRSPIVNQLRIKLSPKVDQLYKKMESEFFLALKNGEVEALNEASKLGKCHQIANGALYLEDKKWEVIHDSKLEALAEIIDEANGAPILVVYHFKSDIVRLKEFFKQGVEFDDDPATQKKWNKGQIPLLFIQPASAGHGLNLQDGGNIIVFFSMTWDLEQHDQVIERIGPMRQLQSGHNRSVFIHYILAENTIDEEMLERLQTKKEVQEILLNATKRKGY